MDSSILSSGDTGRARALLISHVHLDRKSFAVLVVGLQSLAVVSIMLDLPLVRQVAGFLYLTLVPGIVLMRALKLKESSVVEHVAVSVGLSISLIMFLGFLVNDLGLLIGVEHPLSLASLLFPLSLFVLVACSYIYLTEERLGSEPAHKSLSISVGGKRAWLAVTVFLGLPIISLVGCFLSSSLSNNIVLLCLTLGISAVFLLTVVSARIVPAKLYPLALFAIAVALLLSTSMGSQYITGYDLHSEYYCFVLTKMGSAWTPDMLGIQTPETVGIQSYASMLSVTILPLFYSVVLNVRDELIFKVVYPIILSIVPVVLFYVYREFFEQKLAMLAIFFFISYATFFVQMAYLARQMIAELFFVLLLLLYAKKGFKTEGGVHRYVLFIFFFFGIVVSHYAMTYLLVLYVLLFVLVTSATDHRLNKTGVTHLLLLVALTLTWYVFSFNSAAFHDLTASLNRIVVGFSDIFGGRDQNVLKAIGLVSLPSIWRRIGQYTFYIVEILIVAGFVKLWSTRKKLGSNQLFFSGALVSMLLLALSVALPNFSTTLNETRILQIALFFLAPALVLGGETFFNLIFRISRRLRRGLSSSRIQRISLVPVAVLIVIFFLFQSGFIFALAGDIPASPSLTTDRSSAALKNMALYDSFTFSEEVFGAKWTLVNIPDQYQIYCDYISQIHVLRSYGLVSDQRVDHLTVYLKNVNGSSYIFLRPLNTIYGIIRNSSGTWIMPENASVLENADRIYSNGGCQIFKGSGS